jgi:hypothetical protein
MHPMRLRKKAPQVVAVSAIVWLATVAAASATPLPSPLAIELSNPSQRGEPGDVLTFSGVLRNLTAHTLFIDGWGLSMAGNVSGYPVRFSFTSEWFAWPKAVAFGPFQATPTMPLFAAAIAADFPRSIRRLGSFAVAAYPLGTPIYNPDGSLTHDNAYGHFNYWRPFGSGTDP